jgi:hypothetical protein
LDIQYLAAVLQDRVVSPRTNHLRAGPPNL